MPRILQPVRSNEERVISASPINSSNPHCYIAVHTPRSRRSGVFSLATRLWTLALANLRLRWRWEVDLHIAAAEHRILIRDYLP